MHHCGVAIDPDTLPDDPVLLRQMLRELHTENDRLRPLIQRFTRHQFGRRSEQLTAEQLQFALEDLEQTAAENQAARDATALAHQNAVVIAPPATTVPCPHICRATRW